MNKKVLKTLEFDKIRKLLEDRAASEEAKERILNLEPFTNLLEIETAQRETAAALGRIYADGEPSFYGLSKVEESLQRLNLGSSLMMGELIKISKNLDVALRIRNYGQLKSDGTAVEDILSEKFENIQPLSNYNNEIKRCIISEDEMSDDASEGLKDVRRKIAFINNRIKKELDELVNKSSKDGILQNNRVTIRNGRYCLPIKNEYRNRLDGIIHDQSSTGSTIFVEPTVVVKHNNELNKLYIDEQKEIEKVLAKLSNEAALHLDSIKTNLSILTELDFIFAKGSLAKWMSASEPIFNEDRRIRLKRARHPLIDKTRVVPIDIELGENFDLLVITGPNTGGKTASLKTVGLLSLMGQAGLHIPAFEKSELGVFNEVYADIGDEQSIEQSLSTFSSHMINIVDILKKSDEDSLVLFDELGAGTDPTEGAALAIAILENLHKKNTRVMATTHYSELKLYALTTDGVRNASLEFDIETLMPTYRILIGIPGKSNAFAISQKLGLPNEIIEDAKDRIDINDRRFEDVIEELNKSRKYLEEEELRIRNKREEIERERNSLETDVEKLERKRESLLEEAKREATRILEEAKEVADASIKKYNKWGLGKASARELEEERSKLRKKLDAVATKSNITAKEGLKNRVGTKKLNLGDKVLVISMGLKGIVNTLPDSKGNLTVTMGIMKSQVNVKDLAFVNEDGGIKIERDRPTSSTGIGMGKSLTIRPEKNLVGLRTSDARAELEKYLDDAYLSHLPQVRIIHGRGTGALKSMVNELLKSSRYVKSYRSGEYNEGGTGATVVTFKS